jgi:isochorismate pyruvate lyase
MGSDIQQTRRRGSPPMMPKRPEQCASLADVRVEIDRCDKALVDMIAERFGYVERAWQIKLGLKQEANVPWRNQQVIDRVRARAEERGVPPDLCEALWRQMIGWFIQYEEEKLRSEIEEQAAEKK